MNRQGNTGYFQEDVFMRELPKANEIWLHFKGGKYQIITLAEHTETGEKFVIYKALSGTMKTYARPLKIS